MKSAEAFEQIQAIYGRLSRRERLILIAAILVFLGLFILMISNRITSAIEDHQGRITYKEQGLHQVIQMSAGFREARAEQRRLESQLRGQEEISLFSHLEELAKAQGITISNMRPRQPVTESGIREETVEVSLEGVSVDKVAGLVNAIQRSPHMVKISSLRMRRRDTTEDMQASLTVSSYSLEKAE